MTGETPNPLQVLREAIDAEYGLDIAKCEAALAQVETLAEAAPKLIALVRVGFLLSVNGERATADVVLDPGTRELLFTILQAEDTDAAVAALVPFAAHHKEKPYHPDDDASDYIE